MNTFHLPRSANFLSRLQCMQGFLALLLLCSSVNAMAQNASVPPPLRLLDAPAPAQSLPLSGQPVLAAPPKNTAPQPSLESQLQPDLKPMPKDPTERALENTRRLLRERNSKQGSAVNRSEASSSGVVFIFGERPTPEPGIGQTLEQMLTPSDAFTVTESTPGGMARRECLVNCTGPVCCVTVERDPVPWKRTGLR